MILSPRTIEVVADRIEQVYFRRHPESVSQVWDGRIWTMAARALLEAHRRASWLPLDPELFVAAQAGRSACSDPWSLLSPAGSISRYRRRVLHIVQSLRKELRAEVRRAESLIRRGEAVDAVVSTEYRWLSPLGRYIVAYRNRRPDLMHTLRDQARHQHDACPLYRLACRTFLPMSVYPAVELIPGLALTPRQGPMVKSPCLN